MKTSIPKLHSLRMKNHENVEWLNIVTTQDLDPQTILIRALNERMKEVVIIGYDRDGGEYFASSVADGGKALWHLERAKKVILDIPDSYGE